MAWLSIEIVQKKMEIINIRVEIKEKWQKFQITKIRNESGDITTELTEIWRIVRDAMNNRVLKN